MNSYRSFVKRLSRCDHSEPTVVEHMETIEPSAKCARSKLHPRAEGGKMEKGHTYHMRARVNMQAVVGC